MSLNLVFSDRRGRLPLPRLPTPNLRQEKRRENQKTVQREKNGYGFNDDNAVSTPTNSQSKFNSLSQLHSKMQHSFVPFMTFEVRYIVVFVAVFSQKLQWIWYYELSLWKCHKFQLQKSQMFPLYQVFKTHQRYAMFHKNVALYLHLVTQVFVYSYIALLK